ncbi:MAG: CRISPR system precrRNA processing endoribonuclease RAMP protein Cas6 [Bacillota bacterium]|nr:CRISPR system precrRNA processing endoribonuclease RAMP protein Cas6 [Bacillota bacterium]
MTGESSVWRIRFRLAVDRWRGDGRTLYSPSHSLFFQLLSTGSGEAARSVHDARGRKPFALSPLRVSPRGGMGVAEWTVAVWGPLVTAMEGSLEAALRFTGDVLGHRVAIVEARPDPKVAIADLGAAGAAAASVEVEFLSPTFFSFGRRFGRQQYELLPLPELVVGSWAAAWCSAGGTLPAPMPEEAFREWLGERVAVRSIEGLHTVTVDGGETALTGFLGTVRYAWIGPEPWGPGLLAALARFASYAGTGAKTGHGFGLTAFQGGSETRAGLVW